MGIEEYVSCEIKTNKNSLFKAKINHNFGTLYLLYI